MSDRNLSPKKKRWRWVVGVAVVYLFVSWGPNMTSSQMCKKYADSVEVQIGPHTFKMPSKDIVAIFNDQVLVKYMQCSDVTSDPTKGTRMTISNGSLHKSDAEFFIGISYIPEYDLAEKSKVLVEKTQHHSHDLPTEDGFYRLDDHKYVSVRAETELPSVVDCGKSAIAGGRLCSTAFYVGDLVVGVEQVSGKGLQISEWKEIIKNAIALVEQLQVKPSL